MKQYKRMGELYQDEKSDQCKGLPRADLLYKKDREVTEREQEDSREEAQVIAQAILSIKSIETELDRKEKNRIAAKKSREKRLQYIEDIEYQLYHEKAKNHRLHQHINILYNVLEKLMVETEISLAEKRSGMLQMASIFVGCDEYISLPTKHKEIIGKLKYFLFTSKTSDI
ncbi:hypothetical protein NEIG_00015 [Nematocida sp. ERTm5]|nr:hypothetical protein NEIRO02_0026 [Nematocida sp. AWRm79]OAG30503.1 hypothetical protein NEIG_00015 [Nematocida sp. ERTm5]